MNLVHLSILFILTCVCGLLLSFMAEVNAGTAAWAGDEVAVDRCRRMGRWSARSGGLLGLVGVGMAVLWAMGVGR